MYVLTLGETKPKRYTKTQSAEVAARFLDNNRILFQQNGNLFVLNTADATLIQLSKEANPQAFISVGQRQVRTRPESWLPMWFRTARSKRRSSFRIIWMISYRRHYPAARLDGAESYGDADRRQPRHAVRDQAAQSRRREQLPDIRWAADGTSLIVDRNDKDTKRRQLFYVHNAGSKGEQTILLTEETDDKWIAPLSSIVEPNPKDPSQIVFGSEKDGYQPSLPRKTREKQTRAEPDGRDQRRESDGSGFFDGGKSRAVNKGHWQVEWAKWVADGSSLFIPQPRTATTGREMYSIFPGRCEQAGGASPITGEGMKDSPQLDNTNDQPILLYEYSRWNQPGELYAVQVCSSCRGLTMPRTNNKNHSRSIFNTQMEQPEVSRDPPRDNKKIPGQDLSPHRFQ